MREEEIVLENPKRWKAVAHPLRIAILRALGDGAMTNEELAQALGKASGALFYHTRRLLDAGLLEPAGTRQKGHLTEKLYRRAAAEYRIPVVEDGSAPPLGALLQNAVEMYENTWQTEKGFSQLGYNLVYSVSAEAEAELHREIEALKDRFMAAVEDETATDRRLVALTMLIHRLPERKR